MKVLEKGKALFTLKFSRTSYIQNNYINFKNTEHFRNSCMLVILLVNVFKIAIFMLTGICLCLNTKDEWAATVTTLLNISREKTQFVCT